MRSFIVLSFLLIINFNTHSKSNSNTYCWGYGNSGQIGNNQFINQKDPTPIDTSNVNQSFSKISAGSNHTCAITSDEKKLYCWGHGEYGQIGNGLFEDQPIPTEVSFHKKFNAKFEQISAGKIHTCALTKTSNNIYCWGASYPGLLGIGKRKYEGKPILISSDEEFKSISAGGLHTCAITKYGKSIYCWGQGQGYGDTGNNYKPVKMDTKHISEKFSQIMSGGLHTCALTEHNQTYCWGAIGEWWTKKPRRVDTSEIKENLKKMSIGWESACAITEFSNSTYCWQRENTFRIQKSTIIKNTNSVQSNANHSFKLVDNAANGNHTCAVSDKDELYCWGENNKGQLGIGSIENEIISPTKIDPSKFSEKVELVSTGYSHTCAITNGNKTTVIPNTIPKPQSTVSAPKKDKKTEFEGLKTEKTRKRLK